MAEGALAADAAALYDRDFFEWTQQQAQALRAAAQGNVGALDWENLAEEIESLGRSLRRELASRLITIIEHLAKLEHARASEPRPGWEATVSRERREIELLLEDSPSLRRQVAALIAKETARALRRVSEELRGRKEIDEATASALISRPSHYSPDKVLGDWLPARPIS